MLSSLLSAAAVVDEAADFVEMPTEQTIDLTSIEMKAVVHHDDTTDAS